MEVPGKGRKGVTKMLRKGSLVAGMVIALGTFCSFSPVDAAERAIQLEIPGCHT